MAMCAGVQKVSRPIVMCHEMSHMIPMVRLVEARLSRKPGQKRDSAEARVSGWSSARASVACATGSSNSEAVFNLQGRGVANAKRLRAPQVDIHRRRKRSRPFGISLRPGYAAAPPEKGGCNEQQ